ncbi:peptidase T [Compostibacter hankyongensis]|uniref:Peptidase T n=1 Tax=Compostibacter hankyongensis TaxID=1007089 RepID=A0ABP8G4M6_9BACT
MFENYAYTVADRFLRYVRIDTQSDPRSTGFPSSAGQLDLLRLLAQELRDMGLADAELDEYGYVYATLPANTAKQVPVICFCSHADTSPDCSGAGVKPLVHRQYDGNPIVLPDDPAQVIRAEEHPALAGKKGEDIITASGTTLLGADDKAGLAEIMDAVHYLVAHPEIKHGNIRLLFTPDEEIGRGVDHVDLKKLGADYGYTMDGETAGSLEDETFCADAVEIIIHGIAAHTGFAKGRMVNAVKVAAAIIDALPKDQLSPETTEGKAGFIHPLHLEAGGEKAVIEFLLRDFTLSGLRGHEQLLQAVMERVLRNYPGAQVEWKVTEQYRNMKTVLDRYPEVTAYAEEAIRRAGLRPERHSIRGGTDGCRLSFMGLPCPNIFAGGHAFHSRQEWISIQDMQKAVQTIVHLCSIWEEKA